MILPTAQIRRRQKSSKSWQGEPGIFKYFALIFIISLGLAGFTLFMQRHWRDPGQRGVLIIHDGLDSVRKPLTLVVIDPESPRLVILPLPPEQSLTLLLNYGSYQSQALVRLTQLEKLRWDFLLSTLALQYGVALDGMIWTKLDKIESPGDLRSLALGSIFRQNPTTLAWWDRGRLLADLQRIPEHKVDRSFPTDADEAGLEQWASRLIQDTQIRHSGVTVAIQNGSGVQGLAARLSRMLRIMGYDVRALETVAEVSTSKLVFRPNFEENVGGHWARLRLQAVASFLSPETDAQLPEKLRADLVVIVGTDLKTKFSLHQ